MFDGTSPQNHEQKCLCVLVLDISGSMQGEPINELNKGLQEFHREISLDIVASQRLEIGIITFGSTIQCVQEPALVDNFQMPILSTNGSTKLVDGVKMSLELIENRKNWYKETGQNYYRPMIVLITDGEPDSDQDINGLSREVSLGITNKKFTFYSLGVGGYNHQKLAQICANPSPLPLKGCEFAQFFKWLSSTISIITKSKEGDILQLPSISGWTQITV